MEEQHASLHASLFAGFTELSEFPSRRPGKLLVPIHIQEAAQKARDSMDEPAPAPPPAPPEPSPIPPESVRPRAPATPSIATGPHDLATIRINTKHDLADAQALAARILDGHLDGLDSLSERFCVDLFIAVSVRHAYTTENTWTYVLNYLVDPDWENANQIVLDVVQAPYIPAESAATAWISDKLRPALAWSQSAKERLIKRAHKVWTKAIAAIDQIDKPQKKRISKAQASIQIFTPKALSKASACVDKVADDKRVRADRDLDAARENGGYRLLPDSRRAGKALEKLSTTFENLAEPIQHLQTQLALAGAMPTSMFRISPMLLLGDPGIGKTHLAMQLADALGVQMDKISAGAAQGAFQLVGSHPSWTRAMPGSIYTLLSAGKSAAPVMVIDEVDKIGEGQYPIEPALLDLLESGTARTFKDEFYDLEFDASRIIYILTANDLSAVPAPLQSRMSIFHVPRPKPAQRLRIIEAENAKLRASTRKRIALDTSAHELAERVDMDLRQTIRLVHEAFTRAMLASSPTATLQVPESTGRRAIGFMKAA